MTAGMAALLAISGVSTVGSETFNVGSETFICNFEQNCSSSGECGVTDERINILLGYTLGTGRWARVDYGDAAIIRKNARIETELGLLKWENSGELHMIIFTPESPETIWVRHSQQDEGSEILFGECRNAF